MTIHNLKFQGRWDLDKIKDALAIDDYYFTEDKLEYYKDANLLKGGLVYANKITTVSKKYAQEITTAEYGEGLEGLLYARQNDTVGIVNGIGDGTYGISNPITVEQACTSLYRYSDGKKAMEVSGKTAAYFTDGESISPWAADAVNWAVENGIYVGVGEALSPCAAAPRWLVATMFANYARAFAA